MVGTDDEGSYKMKSGEAQITVSTRRCNAYSNIGDLMPRLIFSLLPYAAFLHTISAFIYGRK